MAHNKFVGNLELFFTYLLSNRPWCYCYSWSQFSALECCVMFVYKHAYLLRSTLCMLKHACHPQPDPSSLLTQYDQNFYENALEFSRPLWNYMRGIPMNFSLSKTWVLINLTNPNWPEFLPRGPIQLDWIWILRAQLDPKLGWNQVNLDLLSTMLNQNLNPF